MEIYAWNPNRARYPQWWGRYLPMRSRTNNFGDLLGPLIVARILDRARLDQTETSVRGKLLTVGSVMHFARSGDVVWGTGVNGKIPASFHRYQSLDVRAVRGPLTRRYLQARGIEVPEVYGDPALLLALLFPELVALSTVKTTSVLVVPNLNDARPSGGGEPGQHWLDPRTEVMASLRRIVQSELVVGSSLHAVVVAEAFGIPARRVHSPAESSFKYEDYYEGTGRSNVAAGASVAAAIELGGAATGSTWSGQDLLDAFPYDLWNARPAARPDRLSR